MGKTIFNEKKLTALDDQLKRKFDCAAHGLSIINAGNNRFKVHVGGSNLGGFHLAMTISGWLKDLGFDPSYLGKVRGKFGYHALEVRS